VTPFRLAGAILLVAGVVIVVLGGVSYTRERQSVELGSVELIAERKGVIPPVVGVLAILVGAGLMLVPSRRS
jgi:drug/metabolite transporter (DMT)-like permease